MGKLRIALLQIAAHGNDQSANAEKGEAACREARRLGCDIALFPELWNIGYASYPGAPDDYHEMGNETAEQLDVRAQWQAQAIPRDGAFVQRFVRLAKELEMAIAITYLERWEGAPRNTVSVIDRTGRIVLTYAKVHTCDFSLEAACTPGDDFPTAALDTAQGSVQIGAMICYDREFPESARILMLRGAEIILTPNCCDLELNRLSQYRTRAYENMVGVAMANYPSPHQNGHSIAFDGIGFERGGKPRDMLLVEAGEMEGIYVAEFDLDALRDYRGRETWGNSFRKPHRYAALTSLEVQAPFVRKNARGELYDRLKR